MNIPFAYPQQFIIDSSGLSKNPTLQLSKQTIEIEEQKVKVAKAQTLPGFNIGYINQSLQGYYDIN
jgi:outer membrane protein TolC